MKKTNISSRPADLKNRNTSSILRYVYRNGVTSKPELSEALGISKPTVSGIVDELVEGRFLRAVGIGRSSLQGGKRPTLFDFNPRSGSVIALYLGTDTLEGALVDLGLTIVNRLKLSVPTGVADTLSTLASVAQSLMDQANQSGLKVLGIGVSTTGVVEPTRGVLIKAVNLIGWTEVPIASFLESQLHVPVWVDNETRNIALAEKWFGQAKDEDTFITLHTTGGLGAGVFINGTILRGLHNRGGEFGHITVDLNGPKCPCGNVGCWELYASDEAFLHLMKPMMKSSDVEGEQPFEFIGLLYRSGDVDTKHAVETYASYLATGIVNMVNIFNPNMVILYGQIKVLGNSFLRQVESIIQKRALSSYCPAVSYSVFGEDGMIIGAATLVIQEAVDGQLIVQSTRGQGYFGH